MAELAKRELARRHLLNFIQYNFEDYKVNWHHRLLIDKLEAVERGDIKRLMVFMPPRHGKSEIISVQFPSWLIGRNRDRHIIEASYSGELAVDFGRQVRNIVAGQDFQKVFSNVTLAEDSQAKGKWNTNGRGAYNAVGIGGATTGKGADYLLIDDPVKNRQEADSQVIRDTHWGWYRSTARTRLSPNGAIVLVMTRWHDDDLAGRILSQGSEKWDILNLPAIAEQDEFLRKKGDALWANHFTTGLLQEIKEDIGLYEWASLYQQQPISSENQEFKKSWFQEREFVEIQKLSTRNYLTIDTAISQKDSADYTGICENFVDRENFWNIRAWRQRLNPTDLIDLIFTRHQEFKYEAIGIEKTIYLDALKPFLDAEMRKRNKFLPIVELHHNQTAKEIRIRGLIPRYESRSIFHLKGECKDLEDELLRFPKATHDDISDAVAYQLQIAVNRFDIEKKKEERGILSQFDAHRNKKESYFSGSAYLRR